VARLVVAPRAINDVREILAFLSEKGGNSVAEDYFARFRSTFERLVAHPRSGSPRPRLGRAVRIAVVRPYIVIYRISADAVMIMRVLHGRRRITRRTVSERTD
jgi:toxin ParE1/3/4